MTLPNTVKAISAGALLALSASCSLPERPAALTADEVARTLANLEGKTVFVSGFPKNQVELFVAPSPAHGGRDSTFTRYFLIDPETSGKLQVLKFEHVGPLKVGQQTRYFYPTNFNPHPSCLMPDGQVIVRAQVDSQKIWFDRVIPLDGFKKSL